MAELARTDLRVKLERAVLVGIVRPAQEDRDLQSFEELHLLAESAGAHLAGGLTQRRVRPDPKFFLGRGKVEELRLLIEEAGVDLIIVNHELRPAQGKNLEEALGVKVLDRTELILDIFASRARTRLARLQVELAQLEYSLPRLRRMWTHLSRIEGGIGMRGPGERQIEEDRRIARKRIVDLKAKLKEIGRRRQRQVASRRGQFRISLVGYTNSGKSTLLNRLTGSRVQVQDRLFATLDTKTSTWNLQGGRSALLSDTVGFVQDLPHTLVASFQATLEETIHADLLLHVVDLLAQDVEGQIQSVETVLAEIKAHDIPTIMVFNKTDALAEAIDLLHLQTVFPENTAISALTGHGVQDLEKAVTHAMDRTHTTTTFHVPHSAGHIEALLRRRGRVMNVDYNDDGIVIEVMLPPAEIEGVRKLLAELPK